MTFLGFFCAGEVNTTSMSVTSKKDGWETRELEFFVLPHRGQSFHHTLCVRVWLQNLQTNHCAKLFTAFEFKKEGRPSTLSKVLLRGGLK
jgi:hypothetical protein